MLNNAETLINQRIGFFSTIPQLYQKNIDSYQSLYLLPGQCRVFLTSSTEFIWFIESYDVIEAIVNSAPEVPKITLENKKIYPAKVTGINLASDSVYGYGNGIAFRPGFGQTILSDLSRPVKSVSVLKNDLGLTDAVPNVHFSGPLGRLMSIAVKVDKTKAALYDANKKKENQKSLNSQDYEQIPTYPTYDLYVTPGGY